eukprot:1617993-Pyramimonas_sp.AAC.1
MVHQSIRTPLPESPQPLYLRTDCHEGGRGIGINVGWIALRHWGAGLPRRDRDSDERAHPAVWEEDNPTTRGQLIQWHCIDPHLAQRTTEPGGAQTK